MSRKNFTISFDSESFAIYDNGKVYAKEPCCLIRKKSNNPSIIAFGRDAKKRHGSLNDNEMFSLPFKDGKVFDELGARIYVKYILKKYFVPRFSNLYVLITCGMQAEDAIAIESVFVRNGYPNVFLLDRTKVLVEMCKAHEKNVALYADNDLTEISVISSGVNTANFSLPISFNLLGEQLRDYFAQNVKLKLSFEESIYLAKNFCSLFRSDGTKIVAEGTDTITFLSKSIILSVRDVFPIVQSLYLKITGLIRAAVTDASDEVKRNVFEKGILICGNGATINGYPEFIREETGISCSSETTPDTLEVLASMLISSEKEWREDNV